MANIIQIVTVIVIPIITAVGTHFLYYRPKMARLKIENSGLENQNDFQVHENLIKVTQDIFELQQKATDLHKKLIESEAEKADLQNELDQLKSNCRCDANTGLVNPDPE